MAYYPGGQAFFLGLFPILAPDLIYHIRKQTFLLTESRKDLCKDKDDDKYNKY